MFRIVDLVNRMPTTIDQPRMIHPIVKYGNPVLEKPGEPVTDFGGQLKKLVEDMFESMYEAEGVGLAAPQIGISQRLAVIDVSFKGDPEAKLVLASPEIIHKEGKQFCLASAGFPNDKYLSLDGWYGSLLSAFMGM